MLAQSTRLIPFSLCVLDVADFCYFSTIMAELLLQFTLYTPIFGCK